MKKVFLGLGLFLIILAGYFYWNGNIEILNPKGTNPSALWASPLDRGASIKVFGFLPTWMIGKTIEYTNEVDYLIFLGVEVDEKGNLIWDGQSKKINNETYLKQKDLIWKNGGKNILGIKLFTDEKIDSLMASIEAQNNLINQLKTLRQTEKFDGINVDFEYQGNPTAVLSEKMIGFMAKLKESGLGEISLDVFVNTINKGSAEQINSLINSVDNLIIMAYDFHRPGVDYAGAVAPMQSEVGDRNIMEVVEKILSLNFDKEKIVMVYPLYGYEWKTYTKDFEAPVIRGWYQMASWNRVNELIKSESLSGSSSNLMVNWDELSMTPWVVFEEGGEIHQIYFENERSLKAKLDLVKQNQLGGVGFWALGYEGEDKRVWEIMKSF
ncbi:MAG: glycosyl hydrolase family 18 protein [Candidatus Shapirobacteria bacterium]|nr:glycosyl hydrolase family 18 protein [Candidatus Shapirobacteria bacterium]MDD3003214.1 glycosyl hydrolase family 18 protein [Candidatus Shapirobacteria bacterium]MDD4382872.1 glycosyl hydrolase family 18 protein [Candidatus Shapirobacteria bacterium]